MAYLHRHGAGGKHAGPCCDRTGTAAITAFLRQPASPGSGRLKVEGRGCVYTHACIHVCVEGHQHRTRPSLDFTLAAPLLPPHLPRPSPRLTPWRCASSSSGANSASGATAADTTSRHLQRPGGQPPTMAVTVGHEAKPWGGQPWGMLGTRWLHLPPLGAHASRHPPFKQVAGPCLLYASLPGRTHTVCHGPVVCPCSPALVCHIQKGD